jgi:hypothetical protein
MTCVDLSGVVKEIIPRHICNGNTKNKLCATTRQRAGTDGLHDSPLEEAVTSEPVSEIPSAIFSLVFTLPNARVRAHARDGKVDVVRVELIPEIICGI